MLSIGLTYFVRDIWNNFEARKTNDRVYTERKNYFNHPTISICFEPQVNETSLMKYNKTIRDIHHRKLNLEVPPATFAEEVSFKLGRDFTIGLGLSGHESNHGYLFLEINAKDDYNVKTFDNGSEFPYLIEVEELPLVYYGECTVLKISDKIRGSIKLTNQIDVKFKSTEERKLPTVTFFFTSEENSHGSFWFQWMEGEVFAININPQDDKIHSVSLKQQIRKKLTETSYCSLDLNYYSCISTK